jgi:hypothetical protein
MAVALGTQASWRAMMTKKTQKKATQSPESTALTASINAVYEKYGTNLTAFYRDVRDKLNKEQKATKSQQSPK